MKQRRRVLDMGYTCEEFDRTLQTAFCASPARLTCVRQEDGWRLSSPESLLVHIQTQQQPPRNIGMLALPRLRVELALEAETEELIDQFLCRFHRHFHKGGG